MRFLWDGLDDGEIVDWDGVTNCEIVAGVMTRYLHISQNNPTEFELMPSATKYSSFLLCLKSNGAKIGIIAEMLITMSKSFAILLTRQVRAAIMQCFKLNLMMSSLASIHLDIWSRMTLKMAALTWKEFFCGASYYWFSLFIFSLPSVSRQYTELESINYPRSVD